MKQRVPARCKPPLPMLSDLSFNGFPASAPPFFSSAATQRPQLITSMQIPKDPADLIRVVRSADPTPVGARAIPAQIF